MVQHVNEKTPKIATAVLMLLCNLTREKCNANKVYEAFVNPTATLNLFIKLFSARNTQHDISFDYVSYLLSNLCQLHEVRM